MRLTATARQRLESEAWRKAVAFLDKRVSKADEILSNKIKGAYSMMEPKAQAMMYGYMRGYTAKPKPKRANAKRKKPK